MSFNRKKLKRGFTLIEMLASMAVFLILITVMMRFFVSAQNVWLKTSRRNELYSNARIALDLISRDLQCALYNNDNSARGIYPFWFREISADVNELNFIAATDLKPNGATSNICEIRYTYDVTSSSATYGWMLRNCVGDDDTTDYNFMDHPFSTATNTRMAAIWPSSGVTYAQVIPGVVKLEFACYGQDGSAISALADSALLTGDNGKVGTPFPVVVTIRLKLMDQDNWAKYVKLRGPASDEADKLLSQTARTFSRTVYLGKRESI